MKRIQFLALVGSSLIVGGVSAGPPDWLPADAPLQYDAVTKTYSIRMQVGEAGKKRVYRLELPDIVNQMDLDVQMQVRLRDTDFEYGYRIALGRSSRWHVMQLFLGPASAVTVRSDRTESMLDLTDGSTRKSVRGQYWRVTGRSLGPTTAGWGLSLSGAGTDPAELVLSSWAKGALKPGGPPIQARLWSAALPALMYGWAGDAGPQIEFPEFPDAETHKWYTLWVKNNVLRFPVITPGIPRPEPYVRSKVVEAIAADVRMWGERKFPEWSDRKLPESVRAGEIAGLIEAAGRAEGAALDAALADLVNRTEAMPELSVTAKHLMQVYAQIIRRAPEK